MLMLMLMLMLMVEATTWLPTLPFELLLVSACKFCNFESYLDKLPNARGSGDDDEGLPDGGHPPCSHSYGSLVAHHC